MFPNAAFHIWIYVLSCMKQNSRLMECIVFLVCYWYCSTTTVSSILPLSPIGFWYSSVSPNTVYHHLPKKQEGKTLLLNRTILTRHYLVFFNNAHIKYFWLVPKKKKKNSRRKKKIEKNHTGKLSALSVQVTNQSITFYPNLTSKGNFLQW